MAVQAKFDPEKYSKSRYSTVIGIAKRARQIAQKADEDKVILCEKPVKIAMRELIEGKFSIVSLDEGEQEKTDL